MSDLKTKRNETLFYRGRSNNSNSSREKIIYSQRLRKEQLRHLAHEMLTELSQCETLLQSLPIGIILLDTQFHIQLMNRVALRCPLFSMYLFEGTLAKNPIWQNLVHEELAHWLEQELQTEAVSSPREFSYYDDNNQPHVLLIEISSQVQQGVIDGWIILITDVSELRRQESKVQQLDLLASFATVTAGVAHEIKNPLTAMSLHIQIMQRLLRQRKADNALLADDLMDKFQDYCQIVQDEIERLNTFITDFLLTVRPLELELVSQPLQQVIETCLELLKPELELKNIGLELKLESNISNVALDTSMFRRLLLNLLQNSMQAIAEKTELYSSSSYGRQDRTSNTTARILFPTSKKEHPYHGKLCLRSYSKNDKVYLELADNGIGMTQEVQKKIFKPFFTTRAKGTGLGMTMVLHILQTHNGDLQIQSTSELGTIMRLELPVFHREQKLLGVLGNKHRLQPDT